MRRTDRTDRSGLPTVSIDRGGVHEVPVKITAFPPLSTATQELAEAQAPELRPPPPPSIETGWLQAEPLYVTTFPTLSAEAEGGRRTGDRVQSH